MANIPFTSNYTDLSSQRGFQFKFFCQKCGNGYMSTFQTNSWASPARRMRGRRRCSAASSAARRRPPTQLQRAAAVRSTTRRSTRR